MSLGEGWELNHVGLVVTNRNATLSHFQSLGVGVSVGPQPLLPHEDGHGSLMYYQTLNGDPVTRTYPTGGAHNFRDGECQIGDCQLEVYAMKPGPGMFISEYLAKQGPGINHICFNAPAVEQDTDQLIQRDCPLTFNALVNGKTVENYLDTRRHGDLMLSLRPPATDWEKAWKANNESHPLVPRWRFLGLGIAVRDADASAAYYAGLGFEACADEHRDSHFETRTRRVRIGPIAFEFCESTAAHSVLTDSLHRRGDGVNDLVFAVDDLPAEIARLEARSVKILRTAVDGQSVYLDTRAEGNIMVRLVAGGG